MAFSKEMLFLSCFQILIFLLFCILGTYETGDLENFRAKYGLLQDIQVMMFVGFGFLMTFLKKYGYSSIGFNFLLGALLLQWSLMCQGFFKMRSDFKIVIGLQSLYEADFAIAAILISMGAVLGRTSHIQLVALGIFETVIYAANSYFNTAVLKVADAGGSILIHMFGAYYGLAASYMMNRNTIKVLNDNLISSTYTSDLFSMIGTLFLWLYWPSFNAIDLDGNQHSRAIINTYLSLSGSCVTAYLTSQFLNKNQKFEMCHVQNSTLAGGVAIGATANQMVQPFGAVLIGMIAGSTSVFGFSILGPIMADSFEILDTCGVQFLHGIPGIMGGILSIMMAFYANKITYPADELYEIYPAMNSSNVTHVDVGRTAEQQAAIQALGLVITLTVAIITGLIAGIPTAASIVSRYYDTDQ